MAIILLTGATSQAHEYVKQLYPDVLYYSDHQDSDLTVIRRYLKGKRRAPVPVLWESYFTPLTLEQWFRDSNIPYQDIHWIHVPEPGREVELPDGVRILNV